MGSGGIWMIILILINALLIAGGWKLMQWGFGIGAGKGAAGGSGG